MKKLRPLARSPLSRKIRVGKGFSKGEITAAGLTLDRAEELGIPVDKRRKSIHKENIELLKDFIQKIEGEK